MTVAHHLVLSHPREGSASAASRRIRRVSQLLLHSDSPSALSVPSVVKIPSPDRRPEISSTLSPQTTYPQPHSFPHLRACDLTYLFTVTCAQQGWGVPPWSDQSFMECGSPAAAFTVAAGTTTARSCTALTQQKREPGSRTPNRLPRRAGATRSLVRVLTTRHSPLSPSAPLASSPTANYQLQTSNCLFPLLQIPHVSNRKFRCFHHPGFAPRDRKMEGLCQHCQTGWRGSG